VRVPFPHRRHRVEADGPRLFPKLRRGHFDDLIVALAGFLAGRGLSSVIHAAAGARPAIDLPAGPLTLALYPFCGRVWRLPRPAVHSANG